MSLRNCLHCHAPIAGRNDKKYCSDDCRAFANHEKRRERRLPATPVNEILWKNREILRNLWNQRPTTVTRDALLSQGYEFYYHTRQHITATGAPYYICYDFGFQPRFVNNTKMALVVKMILLSGKDPWEGLKH